MADIYDEDTEVDEEETLVYTLYLDGVGLHTEHWSLGTEEADLLVVDEEAEFDRAVMVVVSSPRVCQTHRGILRAGRTLMKLDDVVMTSSFFYSKTLQ